MRELDKRIAELKGFWWDQMEGVVWVTPPVPVNRYGIADGGRKCVSIEFFCYSSDDAKAFELVDELIGVKSNMFGQFYFSVYNLASNDGWTASFAYVNRGVSEKAVLTELRGNGASRPEAICRAYISAMEMIVTKVGR